LSGVVEVVGGVVVDGVVVDGVVVDGVVVDGVVVVEGVVDVVEGLGGLDVVGGLEVVSGLDGDLAPAPCAAGLLEVAALVGPARVGEGTVDLVTVVDVVETTECGVDVGVVRAADVA
jgi:hypothetical protein